MNIKLIAVVILSTLGEGARAQSMVQVYGNIDAGLIKRSGASLNLGKRANNTLGFKGV